MMYDHAQCDTEPFLQETNDVYEVHDMLVTFTTDAYADITLFGDVALALLKMMGHSATAPGAILAEDVPAATDKDGIVPSLLSAEITARMGRDPGECYLALAREFGEPVYDRIEAPATPEQKRKLAQLATPTQAP